ncbi:MAG: hypothetical protein F9K29_06475 [Hyphomicrobiaceae bacterium]|nr:MAG: hypothetical protein F9K29_06475 [Hyphomicrobiaceae bacterium]
MTYKPNATELNAYVDGELSPPHATHVAEAIARDRELAREVAALARLKAATVAAFSAEAPPLPDAVSSSRGRRRLWWAAGAAAVGVIATISATVLLARAPEQTDAGRVLAVVDGWAMEPAPESTSRPNSAAARMRGAGLIRLLQGLSILELHIVKTEGVADGVTFDLLGPSGCRLALWAGPISHDFASAPALGSRIRSETAVIWQTDATQYLIISRNAPPQKFLAMAAALKRATEGTLPPDDSMRAVVAAARRQYAPCAT